MAHKILFAALFPIWKKFFSACIKGIGIIISSTYPISEPIFLSCTRIVAISVSLRAHAPIIIANIPKKNSACVCAIFFLQKIHNIIIANPTIIINELSTADGKDFAISSFTSFVSSPYSNVVPLIL